MTFQPNKLERFLYWIAERTAIDLRRHVLKQPKPWTQDPILQENWFCSAYRENDKTTIWFRQNVRDQYKDDPEVIFATVMFRWFNKPDTMKTLMAHRLHYRYDFELARAVLWEEQASGPIFSPAYIIQTAYTDKVTGVCSGLRMVWDDRASLQVDCERATTLESLHERFMRYPGLGKFMSYELVTDLRHTYIGRDCTDIMTWANPGPGCIRGLHRLLGNPISKRMAPPRNAMMLMRRLLELCPDDFEMREVEHSLCEFDKYERIREGGRAKRRYNGDN